MEFLAFYAVYKGQVARIIIILLYASSLRAHTYHHDLENYEKLRPQEHSVHEDKAALRKVLRSLLRAAPEWVAAQKVHAPATVDDADTLRILSDLSNQERFMNYLKPIAIPRFSGSANNAKVQKFLISTMEGLGYTVEQHYFMASPPAWLGGARNMTNIYATLDPSAPRRLVLACHFDSKYDPYYQFIGATDSAVPCAQIIDTAAVLQPFLKQRDKKLDVTLQILFLDGEEAFGEWSATDSLYGARKLSEKLKNTRNRFAPNDASMDELDSMDLLVLLDLLGTKDTTLRNFYYNARGQFARLNAAETRLTQLSLIKTWGRKSVYFDTTPLPAKTWVDDDYRPFVEKGVRVLHLISTPFPSVWHKNSDNLANIHYDTINDLNKIFRVYVCEYLHCQFIKKFY